MRRLILVTGDQLDLDSQVLKRADQGLDAVWMAEVAEENTHVWCHKQRIAYFLASMRHFRNSLNTAGWKVHYHELTANPRNDRGNSLAEILTADLRRLAPSQVVVVQPGDLRVQSALQEACDQAGVSLTVESDDHFYCELSDFKQWAKGKKNLVLEYFYRWMRKQHRVLIDETDQPVGGDWNFDKDNRESFSKSGPQNIAAAMLFKPDSVTQGVIDLVATRFADHPGSLDQFVLPVTRKDALQLLQHFVAVHLPHFGTWQDAMWTDQHFLNHSRLSAALNIKLLNPRECVDAAISAWRAGDAPLNSVEGFVRQILGWREFVRGVYFQFMPAYASLNTLDQKRPVPSFFWDGRTDMNCVRHAMQNVLEHGYAHHIQRLMVLGNFAQLWGCDPYLFHEWHMAMYTDAIDWVSLPNALGISQFADGGIVGTKPYCSSGNYINKMSNYCQGCRYDYRRRTGSDACPFTTLYWHFMDRHYDRLKDNGRLKFAMSNLRKLQSNSEEMRGIQLRAEELFGGLEEGRV